MTGLHRTPLTTSQKVEFAASALVRQGQPGAMSALSRAFGVSRPTVYAARATASEVLEQHFDESGSAVCVEVDERQLHRAVVALRVMAPNALRPIEDLLPILYPGVRLSYGKVQQIVSGAEGNAAAFNATADLSKITASALDELFSQGDPVLGGVDLDSGYLFGLSLRETRAGEDWAQVLRQGKAQGLALSVVVKDAALGIAAGVREVFPEAEQRDDCFHALYAMNKVRRQLEQRAYGAITSEEDAVRKLQKIRAREHKRRLRQKHKIVWAQRRCRDAITQYDEFEKAMREAHEAMEYVDLQSGELRDGEHVQRMLKHAALAIQSIDDPACHKVARYLANRAPGLALATADLHTRLTELGTTYPVPGVALACLIWRLVAELENQRRCWQRNEHTRHLLGAFARLNSLVGAQEANELLDAVKALLEHHHRASSAIEGFNAALRPYLYVHKGVTQNFLELFRAYYNSRTRRWGRHQGTSAHQLLTGQPVDDWLSLLGYPPSSTLH